VSNNFKKNRMKLNYKSMRKSAAGINVALLFVFGMLFQVSTAQNSCATALPVTAGTHTVSAINGTNVQTSCSTESLAEWYAYTPASNYVVTVSSDLTVNACKDTNFDVYIGTCDALVCYTSDDDSEVVALTGT